MARLASGEMRLEGQLAWSSNAAFLVTVEDAIGLTLAVYKPRSGERPLWDFPHGTLCNREAAAYVLSHIAGWDLVPETVLRDGPLGPGAVQRYVPHDPNAHFLALPHPDPVAVQRFVAFDVIGNNADRKGGHVLQDPAGRLWGIDHGLMFHPAPKLRTVIWDLAGETIPPALCGELGAVAQALARGQPDRDRLAELLSDEEVEAIRERTTALTSTGRFPGADPDRRSFPWPPV